MTTGSFAERYCTMRGIANWEFLESVLVESLYPQARILRPLLRLKPGYFRADREFISRAGRIMRMSEFDTEAAAYARDPDNRGFLRRALRLRVSAGRLSGIVWSVLREGSSQPFSGDK
jgi:hypothetical protein